MKAYLVQGNAYEKKKSTSWRTPYSSWTGWLATGLQLRAQEVPAEGHTRPLPGSLQETTPAARGRRHGASSSRPGSSRRQLVHMRSDPRG
ncbi:hypothetical protein CRUP_032718 [Coryphaenoides rupestris]|nr:hypothetical protein CRUP_032718 [Coryphaenoides rupestris]